MAKLEYAELSFEAPEGWQDRTIVAFVATVGPEDARLNVVVTREARRHDDSLQTHVQRQLVLLATELCELEMLESQELEVGGRRALRTRYVWRDESGMIDQVVVHVEPRENEPTVTTVTCTSSLDAASTVAPTFERFLASMQPVASKARATPVPPSATRGSRFDATPEVPMPGLRARR